MHHIQFAKNRMHIYIVGYAKPPFHLLNKWHTMAHMFHSLPRLKSWPSCLPTILSGSYPSNRHNLSWGSWGTWQTAGPNIMDFSWLIYLTFALIILIWHSNMQIVSCNFKSHDSNISTRISYQFISSISPFFHQKHSKVQQIPVAQDLLEWCWTESCRKSSVPSQHVLWWPWCWKAPHGKLPTRHGRNSWWVYWLKETKVETCTFHHLSKVYI